MPRYFFNTEDGHAISDEDGDDLPDTASARAMAVDVLAELLPLQKEHLLGDGSYSVTVVEEGRGPLYRITVQGGSLDG